MTKIGYFFKTNMSNYLHTISTNIMFILNYLCIMVVGMNVIIVTALLQIINFTHHVVQHDISKTYMSVAMEIVTKGMTFLINCLPVRIAITGDKLDDSDFIIIANHQSNNDSILIHYWATLHNKSRHIRVLYKSSLMAVPIFGNIMKNLNYIPVTRAWKDDQDTLAGHIKNFNQHQRILIYPEGTRFREKKKKESIEYAIKNNLPLMQHTLVPRIKGFNLILNETKWSTENPINIPVYDVTLVYHPWCIHIHAIRYNRKDCGTQWLMDRFSDKQVLFTQPPPAPNNRFSYRYIEHFCLIAILFYIMYYIIHEIQYQFLLGSITGVRWVMDSCGL